MSEELKNAVIELREDDALRIAKEALEGGADPLSIVAACREAMEVIGQRFADGQAFIPELIMAGEIMQGVTAELKPYLKAEAAGDKLGTVVMCTVQGDIHDIGKDIVVTMLDIAGFNVVDLGVDVPIAKVVDAVRDNKAQVLGLSGLLTVAFESMKATVAAIDAAGLRGDVKIMLGGAPVTDDVVRVRRRRRLGQGRGGRGRARQDVGGRCVDDAARQLERAHLRRAAGRPAWTPGRTCRSSSPLPRWRRPTATRVQLYRDALALKKPATVPIAPWIGLLPFRYYGYTGHDAYYDYEKFKDDWFRFHEETRPDGIGLTLGIVPGQALRHPRLQDVRLARPRHARGHQLPVQREGVDEGGRVRRPDPGPRQLLAAHLPAARCSARWSRGACSRRGPTSSRSPSRRRSSPASRLRRSRRCCRSSIDAGDAAMEWLQALMAVDGKVMATLGIPQTAGGATKAPYDILGDTMRGTRGLMLDKFRQPEKVKAAMDRLVPQADRLGGPLEQHDGEPDRVHPDPQGRRRLHVRRRLQGALLADASRPCCSA